MTETPESAPAVVTPGQAAYERHQIVLRRRFPGIAPIAWAELDAEAQGDWESVARDAIETAESHSAIYLNEIDRLATALRTIRDAHAPGEPGFDVARRTLDDASRVIGTRPDPRLVALDPAAPGRQARQLDTALRGLVQIREHVNDMAERDWADVGLVVNDVIAEVNEIAAGQWMAARPQSATDRITEDTKAYIATRAGSFVTASLVQRHVRIGWARAATELNRLADDHVISMPDSKGRYTVLHVPATATETITKGEA